MDTSLLTNPTLSVDMDFGGYLAKREKEAAVHLVEGVPDYCYAMDKELRQQLERIGAVRAIGRSLLGSYNLFKQQILQMEGVAVGPKQYPEIHAMGVECARRLGIGIPQIFVYTSPIINAYTCAVEETEPFVALSTALIGALEPQGILSVIGHECGHIHNLHSVWFGLAATLDDEFLRRLWLPGGAIIIPILRGCFGMFLRRWSRCAEVSSDRAAVICCGDLEAAQRAMVTLATGGEARLKDINVEEYIKQIGALQSTPGRLLELQYSHPVIFKRLEAMRLFAESDVFLSWRPEAHTDKPVRTIAEVDRLCNQFIEVWATGYQSSAAAAGAADVAAGPGRGVPAPLPPVMKEHHVHN